MKRNIFIFILILLVIDILFFFKFRQTNTPSIIIDNHTFHLLIAKTPDEQHTGLGYRKFLDTNTGMLFVFNQPGYEEFWMKGMEFPLDIIYIWNNKIVTIDENIPIAKKNVALTLYSPKQPADKVLEIHAGLSKKYHLKEGDTVQITL